MTKRQTSRAFTKSRGRGTSLFNWTLYQRIDTKSRRRIKGPNQDSNLWTKKTRGKAVHLDPLTGAMRTVTKWFKDF